MYDKSIPVYLKTKRQIQTANSSKDHPMLFSGTHDEWMW